MDREKNGNAEKTAVCLLQLNMQQLWGGLSGEACRTQPCLGGCVVVWRTVWLHVSVFVCVSKCDELGRGDCQPYIRAHDGTNQSPSRP